MQQQPVGLSAATGPFAKVRLQSGAEGKFFVVVVFFCHDFSNRPCTCSSLLANAAVGCCGSRSMAMDAAIVAVVIRYVAIAVVLGVTEATVLVMATAFCHFILTDKDIKIVPCF